MKNIFHKLNNLQSLSQLESYQLFQSIIAGKITHIQLISILKIMSARNETTDEIIGAIYACLENTNHFPRPNYLFSDIVGTGGDINNTINISTASAFVAAECGLKIVKHCNKGISSKSGSSDLLKKFNINLNASPERSRQSLDEFNICFLFAQKYNNGFKNSINARKMIKNKTIFNLLGPFLNPAIPPFIVLGVYHKKWIYPFAKILSNLNYQRGIVLHGNQTDEVTLHGITYVTEWHNKKIFSYQLKPEDFGIKTHLIKKYQEHSPEENHFIIKKIMQGNGDSLYEELIAVNVAMLLKIFGNEDLKKNVQFALKKIRSGAVYHRIMNVSHILKEDHYERHNTK
ncbi:anthranilate phosphoribosyltransferase [Buchnera aphidicola]|uniref:anthranilate phosphoribosyltransferase n=1 Tax=Buchnera aphidicola TaxID=9 RepID=UPI0034640904